MKNRSIMLIIVLCLVLTLAITMAWKEGSQEPSGSSTEKNAQELARLRQENAGLKSLLEAMQQKSIAEKKAKSAQKALLDERYENEQDEIHAAPSPEKVPETMKQLSFEEQYAQTLRVERSIAAQLDDIIASEAYDEKWAAPTEEKVRESVRFESEGQAKLIDTACRSTLCRAVISFEDVDKKDEVMAILTGKEPFNTGGWIHSEGLEDITIEIYFSREGKDFPRVDSRDPETIDE